LFDVQGFFLSSFFSFSKINQKNENKKKTFKVLGRDGLGDTFTVIDAIYDVSDAVTQKSIGVMSLGGPKSTAMKNAVT